METTLNSIQENNCYQFSRDVARIKENNAGINAILAASNEPFWKITSGASIQKDSKKYNVMLECEIMTIV